MCLYNTRYGTKGRIVCDNKRNATGLVSGSLTGFECFIACDCVNSLHFSFEKERLYPRSLRYWMSSLALNVKFSSEAEHMRRDRRTRLNGMTRLVCRG